MTYGKEMCRCYSHYRFTHEWCGAPHTPWLCAGWGWL